MRTLLILIAFTAGIEILALIHSKRILAGVDPFKWGKAGNLWFKFMMATAASFALSIWNHRGDVPYPAGLVEVPGEVIFLLGYLWTVFDPSLNLMRGKPCLYISDSNGKALDEWFAGRWQLQYINKAAVMIIGILLIIISWFMAFC